MKRRRRPARRTRPEPRRLLLAAVRVFEFWLRARIVPADDGAAVTLNAFLDVVREYPEAQRVALAFVRDQRRSAASKARALVEPRGAPEGRRKGGGPWASGGR